MPPTQAPELVDECMKSSCVKVRSSSLVRSTVLVSLLVSLFLGPTVTATAGGGPKPTPTHTHTHTKKPKPTPKPSISATPTTSPTPTPVETISESAVPSEPATPTTSVAPETAATAGESAAPETPSTTNPDLSSSSEDSNLAWWIMGILVLAALVGGGGLVARSRGRSEEIPEAVTPGGADLATAPAASLAQTPPAPAPTQSPEGELLWGDLGEQDRAKFEQAIRDFGMES